MESTGGFANSPVSPCTFNFLFAQERRIHQEIELQTYLNRLVIEDKERKSEELRKTGEDVDVLVSCRTVRSQGAKLVVHKLSQE